MRIIFSLLLFINLNLFADFPLKNFHVCTISTYNHPNLGKLLLSCKRNEIELDVLAMHQPYFGNATKFIYMIDYLNKLPDDHIVMFVDAFDVLILSGKQQILNKFFKMNANLVMGAEKNCCPYPHLASKYPYSPTPFRYVNTGTYIGYVSCVKEWLNKLQPINPKECDQGKTTLFYLESEENQKKIKLDYMCQLFLPLFMVDEHEVKIHRRRNKIYCETTKSSPCVLHANGCSFHIWNKVYDALIK